MVESLESLYVRLEKCLVEDLLREITIRLI